MLKIQLAANSRVALDPKVTFLVFYGLKTPLDAFFKTFPSCETEQLTEKCVSDLILTYL